MNPAIVWRLASYYRKSGMGLLKSFKTAYQNHRISNKWGKL